MMRMMRARMALGGVSLLLLLCSCEQVLPDIGWERMINQRRGKPYAASEFFSDGKLMQAPPDGTIPSDRPTGSPAVLEGLRGDAYITNVPIPIERALLERGRNRFETFCAACHGIDGTGESLVAHNMQFRKPPSLVVGPVRDFPAGRVMQVISAGYGFMPSYSAELPVHDRWAVVAYLRALQRSQSSELASLPPDVRQRAQESLR